MKHIILLLTLSAVLFSCNTTNYADSTEKQAQRLAEERNNQFLFQAAKEAIMNQDFVLEADRVTLRRGRNIYVTPNTNFISLKDGRATIQTAISNFYAGPNGIGGLTVEGNISNLRIQESKKGNINLSMNVIGRGVSAQVNIELYKDGNEAMAVVNPNFNSNRITLNGKLYSTENSNVFKAKSL